MLEIGTVFANQYRVDKLVGVGGMGLVYQARDVLTNERVAIKVMRRATFDSPDDLERFRREAKALSKLNHHNIVRVYDAGLLDDGAPYMVMELLIGKDLRTELRERGPLPADEIAGYVLQACNAVAAAHERGIVHRDLKPQNLFVTKLDREREVKLLDFGISKLLFDSEASMTASSVMVGTPHYMSPEQVRARRDIDHRTDIWSLGVVLYFMVTGRLPFSHSSPTAVIAAIPVEQPKAPTLLRPNMPLALEGIILRCLEKDPAERFQSAREMADALRPLSPASGKVSVRGAAGIKSLPPLAMPEGDVSTVGSSPSRAATVPVVAPLVTVARRRGRGGVRSVEASLRATDTSLAPTSATQVGVEPAVGHVQVPARIRFLSPSRAGWLSVVFAAALLYASSWAAAEDPERVGPRALEPLVPSREQSRAEILDDAPVDDALPSTLSSPSLACEWPVGESLSPSLGELPDGRPARRQPRMRARRRLARRVNAVVVPVGRQPPFAVVGSDGGPLHL